VRRDRARAEPDERVLDDALCDQLRRDILDGVDRNREADADVAAAAVRRLDLGIDANDPAARVQQRAARVAMVQRGIRLDHIVDRSAVRSEDAPLERTHDAGRDRAVLAERISDGDDGVADPHRIRVAEIERCQRARLRLHLQDGDIGGRIATYDLRRQALIVRKAHLHALRALNDVVVRDDVPGLVDHEAGAQRLLRLRRRAAESEGVEEGIRLYRDAPRRRDLYDAGSSACIDVVDRERLRGAGERRAAGRPSRRSVNHLTHRCRRSAEAAGCGDDADRDRGSGRTGAYERRPMQS